MKYEAHSLGEMLRKVAIDYVRYGYYRYLIAEIPRKKDPKLVDDTIIKTYGVTYNYRSRALRKEAGGAVVVYVRFGHRFILLATEGSHPEVEKREFLDCRVKPIQLSGYTVGVKGGKPNVQMSLKRYRALKKLLSQIALHNEKKLNDFFRRLSPFKFPGILRQQKKLLKMVNAKRKKAGLLKIEPYPLPNR
jgi:DNA-binding Lrp family transcriptional regulator